MELAKIKAWNILNKSRNITVKKLMKKALAEAVKEFKENYIYVEMRSESDRDWTGVRVPVEKDKEYMKGLTYGVGGIELMFGSETINKIIKKMMSPTDYGSDEE